MPAEEIKKESTQKPDIELTSRPLTFKTDMEELAEKSIPDYTLRKIDKSYEGNEEFGGWIQKSGTTTSIIYGEIGDKAVRIDEKQAAVKANEWIRTAFKGFDVRQLDDKELLVSYMCKTMLGDWSGQHSLTFGDCVIDLLSLGGKELDENKKGRNTDALFLMSYRMQRCKKIKNKYRGDHKRYDRIL